MCIGVQFTVDNSRRANLMLFNLCHDEATTLSPTPFYATLMKAYILARDIITINVVNIHVYFIMW